MGFVMLVNSSWEICVDDFSRYNILKLGNVQVNVQVNVLSPLQNPSTVQIGSGCHIQKIMIFMNIMLYSKQMYLNRVRIRVKYHVVYVIVRTCL